MQAPDHQSVFKELFGQSWPLLLAQGASFTSSMVVAYWFAHARGHANLAAYGPISTTTALLAMLNFTALPLNIFMQQARREHDDARVGLHFQFALSVSTLLTILASVPIAFAGDAYIALGHTSETGAAINEFFRAMVYSGGLFPLLTQAVVRRTLVGVQKTKIAMGMTLNSALLSSGTAFLASKYKPTPAGFGYANSASYWLSLCSILGYLALRDDFSSYALFQKKGMLEWRHALPHLKKGAYMMASPTLECLLFAIFSGLIGREGQSAAEAFSVANQYARIVILTSFSAVAGPLGTLMMRHGGPNHSKLTACFHAGLALGMCVATPVLILAFAIPFQLIRPFNAHPEDPSVFKHSLMVIGAGGVMDGGIRIPSSGAIRSFNRDARSLVINVSGLSAGFLMAVLSHVFGLGPIAMILGLYMGVSIAGLAQAWDVYAAIAAAPQADPAGEQHPLISPTAFAAISPALLEDRSSTAPSAI